MTTQTEALKLALEALTATMSTHGFKDAIDEVHDKAITAIKEVLAQPEQEPVAKAMTAHRAVYFMERFKHEEKLLGPNEQAALDFVISMLEAQPDQEPVAWVAERDGKYRSVDETDWGSFPVYTTPPQRKPLTHEQRFDLLTKFEPHKNKWEAPAILIDMVEAAHGIKE